MTGCVAINCSNRREKGFRLFSIPTNVERRKKWLQNLRREQISTKSGYVCEVHFEDSQFESRRVDGWKKLKPNAVPTLFHVPNPPRRIDSPPRKSPYKKLRSEVAGMCAQKVAEVPITSEMNMDYAAPSNHDVSNEVEISSNIPKSLLSSDSEQTAQVEAGSSLEEENGHLLPMLQSARVVANLSLEEENQMLRSQIDKMKLYTTALNLGGLKEPCFETFNLVLHSDHYYKIYKDFILRNGNSRLIECIHKNVEIIFPTCCDLKKKIIKHFFTVRSFCTKNFSENSKQRKNVYGSASLKKA